MIPESELGRVGFITVIEVYANDVATTLTNLGLRTESRGKRLSSLQLQDRCDCSSNATGTDDSKRSVEEKCVSGGGVGIRTCTGCPCAHKELTGIQ